MAFGKSNLDGKLGLPILTFSVGKYTGDQKDRWICEECEPHFVLANRDYSIKGYTSSISVILPATKFCSFLANYDYSTFEHSKPADYKIYTQYDCSVWKRSRLNIESFHHFSFGIKIFLGQ